MLGPIVERKRKEVAQRKLASKTGGKEPFTTREPVAVLGGSSAESPGKERFEAALRKPGVAVIAEIKRYSPSKHAIRPDLDPTEIAAAFERGGAAAISVLTDTQGFGGSLDDIEKVCLCSSLPILRKDFIVDSFQIQEAKHSGASAVLLIAAILDNEELKDLIEVAEDEGLAALVEVHTEKELDQALEAGARIVGVNNRDLDTFEVDMSTATRLACRIPEGVISVAESGIRGPDEVRSFGKAGYDAVLVGEGVLVQTDVEKAVRRLVEGGRSWEK